MKISTHEGGEGWAECVAMSEPLYSPEYLAGAADVIERFLLPSVFQAGDIHAEEVARSVALHRGRDAGEIARGRLCAPARRAQYRP